MYIVIVIWVLACIGQYIINQNACILHNPCGSCFLIPDEQWYNGNLCRMCVCVFIYIYTDINIHMHIITYICIYTYIYIDMYDLGMNQHLKLRTRTPYFSSKTSLLSHVFRRHNFGPLPCVWRRFPFLVGYQFQSAGK